MWHIKTGMQVGLRHAFISADMDATPSLVLAYDFHAGPFLCQFCQSDVAFCVLLNGWA